jgi:hypothetical protein
MGSSEYIDLLMGQRGIPQRREMPQRPALQVQLGGARAVVQGAVNNLIEEFMMRPGQRARPAVREHILMLNRPREPPMPMFNINAEPFFPEIQGMPMPRPM